MQAPGKESAERAGGSQQGDRFARLPGALSPAPGRALGADAGVDTVAGANAIAPDTVPPATEEPIHVEGAAADRPAQPGMPPLVTVPLAAATLLPWVLPLPEAADTFAAGGAAIHLLATAAAPDALSAMTDRTVPSLEPSTAATVAAEEIATAPEARHVAWRDPASVTGASVLSIGAATVVLSDLADSAVLEQETVTPGSGRARALPGGSVHLPGAVAG